MAEYDLPETSGQVSFSESLKTLDLNNNDSVQDFKNLATQSQELLIYNAWSDVENLYRSKGTSEDSVDLLNNLTSNGAGYAALHLVNKSDIAFHLVDNDVSRVEDPEVRGVIENYRGNLTDSWNPPSLGTDGNQTQGLSNPQPNNMVS